MYEELRKQIPNPYYCNELYRIYYDKFSSSAKYYGAVNNKGFFHIYKITKGNNKLLLERFRFNKQHKLIFGEEYILTEKDEEVYKKYLDIYNNK